MASAVFLLDAQGRVLISRNYKGDVAMSCVETFMNKMLSMDAEGETRPVFEVNGISYLYITLPSVYLLAVTRNNANATMILTFLYRLSSVFSSYFGELEEDTVRDNFIVIYELLDEVMDFGLPQTTDPKILQEFIKPGGTQGKTTKEVAVPMTVTQAVSWRPEGIVYRKNEVFLDVVESINLLVSATGQILRSDIMGAVKMRVFLTGMPELRLGLNDRVLFESTGRADATKKSVEMEDVKFHQCVRLSRFEKDRTISFIPPDGEFDLMTYRLNTVIKPLIWVEPVVERHRGSRVEYLIKVTTNLKARSVANNVEISVPVPSDADSPKHKTNCGSVRYAPERDALIWTIKQLQGGKEIFLRAHFGLPSITNDNADNRPPISVKFEVPYYSASGVQVRYLKVLEKSGYQALPWVRYITNAQDGMYNFRIA
eukprot:c4146_g1_i1.p2 GENE.c4146_g1_i1~~c4146_g1_i1.p2  ORF type:complete len:428 (+),score=103.89 c4146_g1_i1:79-1362(+)